VTDTARTLEGLGHEVTPVSLPVDEAFVRDFTAYWGLLAFLAGTFGRRTFDPSFDPGKLDGLTIGLRQLYRRKPAPHAGHALPADPGEAGLRADVPSATRSCSPPVLAHTTPPLGTLSPRVPFDELLDRLIHYVAFTPLNNVAGSPAISLPTGATADGLPIGVQLSASHGDERTLLELAFALEQGAAPWRRIQD